ncbi:hypothetical protein BS47DRAFT_148466 [Hydnum rufescens UP504]|uniref:AB hydrolase-1 domain-containing protein n=1 Tax=Hydnum rufescens UP504 TaxID=1448309 RepID=A0A9P6DNY9_9AGAM|nr:hypothetical protein BS47DRAFT_148466 [Hydnum rufescens UP504]
MPFVALPEDRIRLFYRTNLPGDDVSLISQSRRETLLLLHPHFLSSAFMYPQFQDPHLKNTYNMIAFDEVGCGDTEAPYYLSDGQAPYHDRWVEGAIIARFCDALRLPPVHVFACQVRSVQSAQCFSSIFPDKCRSLTLCSVPRPPNAPATDLINQAWFHLLNVWQEAKDLETLDVAIGELVYFQFASTLEPDELDDVAEHWYRYYAPAHSANFLATLLPVRTRDSSTPKDIASRIRPTLIIQGSNPEQEGDLHPISIADHYAAQLPNVADGVKILRLRNAPHCPSLPRKTAPAVNHGLADFLANLPGEQPSYINPSEGSRARFKRALEYSAELAGLPEIATRNPASVFSFTRITEEDKAYRWIEHRLSAQNRNKWTPVNPDGSLPRRFSERSLVMPSTRPRRDSVIELTKEIHQH